jgi:hypothetical protein
MNEPDHPHARTRSDLANRLIEHRGALVARIRRYLAGAGAPTGQVDDIFSTTVRRTDMLAAAGKIVERLSDESLLALSSAIARNAAREAGREARRERRRADAAAEGLRAREPDELGPISPQHSSMAEDFLSRVDPHDLAIIGLRLRGVDWPATAAELGTSVAAAQRRYYRALKAVGARA